MEFLGGSNVWFTGGINHTWHSGYMRGDHWYYQRGTSSPPRPFFHIPEIQAAAVAEAYSARARDICCQVPPLRRVCWETWNARAVMRINTRVRILPYINYLLDWSLAYQPFPVEISWLLDRIAKDSFSPIFSSESIIEPTCDWSNLVCHLLQFQLMRDRVKNEVGTCLETNSRICRATPIFGSEYAWSILLETSLMCLALKFERNLVWR